MEDAGNWIERLAMQYGAKQAALLREDRRSAEAADFWLSQIAGEHWHEIIVVLRASTQSPDEP
jgi:hypothetical protein